MTHDPDVFTLVRKSGPGRLQSFSETGMTGELPTMEASKALRYPEDDREWAPAAAKTVQQYIDETPVWPDGTPVRSAPMTAMQFRVWGLATAGKFFEGLVVFMTGVALPLILYENPEIGAWRWMYATAIIPAVLVLIGRFFIPECGHWLVSRGRIQQAEHELGKLLTRNPPYPRNIRLAPPPCPSDSRQGHSPNCGYGRLLSKDHRRATLLASLPWFLQDLGTYGIGIFTPTILATVIGAKSQHARNVADLIHNDLLAAKGAAFIDVLLIIGITAAVLLADKAGRIRLQTIGFIGCAAGLLLSAFSLDMTGTTRTLLLFSGFMLFSFMSNMGPNAMTYLIAGEVFPIRVRGKGAGVAASFAKIGAVFTAFLFPVFLAHIGTHFLLSILVGTSLLGALITWVFRIETTGVSLEDVGREKIENRRLTVAK
jgi:hypothetical protein